MGKRTSRRIEPVGPISLEEWTKKHPAKGDFSNELQSKLNKRLKEKRNEKAKENKDRK